MEMEWMGPTERNFKLWDGRGNRTSGFAQYRFDSELESWRHLGFFVPHNLIYSLVSDNVPERVHVTYARFALDINETLAGTTALSSLICSEKLQFAFETKMKDHYYRQFQALDGKKESWNFRPPADLFKGGSPPDTIFIRLCFSG